MDNEGVSTTKKKPIAKKESLDLNRDGKLDREDKSLAAEALARDFKKVPAEPSKPVYGKKTNTHINLTYRKGNLVPQKQIDEWVSMGFNISDWFDD